jgi:hypothetical protein
MRVSLDEVLQRKKVVFEMGTEVDRKEGFVHEVKRFANRQTVRSKVSKTCTAELAQSLWDPSISAWALEHAGLFCGLCRSRSCLACSISHLTMASMRLLMSPRGGPQANYIYIAQLHV